MFVTALTGCEQKILFDDDKNEHIYQLPENGYIFFNSSLSKANTRGELISDMQRNFGVWGFKWDYHTSDDRWDIVRAKATPNVFTEEDETILVSKPEEVTYRNGLYDYSPVKPWENDTRYSFFAYYPYESDYITHSTSSTQNTPYLEYTLPEEPSDMLDILTASVKDIDFTSSLGGNVNFAFRHRLSAIDVQMINLNEPYKKIEDGISTDYPVYIKITDMSITFNNLRYNKVKLYLDNTDPSQADVPSSVGNVKQEYTFTDIEPIKPAETTGDSSAEVTYVTTGNPLIVIPQSTDNTINQFLNGELEFNFQYVIKEGENYTSVTNSLKTDNEPYYDETSDHISRYIPFDMQRDITSGRRYTILLTFTRNATTIDILKDGDWDEYRSTIEFQ